MVPNNPFLYGNPVAPEQLIGRDKELRQIAGRISTGQSTIITGSPRSGKTSVLDYLNAPEKQAELYGDEADHLIFSYLGAYECGPEFSQAQFWHHVLRPLKERIDAQGTDSPLFKAYQIGKENHFESYELEKLIAQIKQVGWRLVLLVDEFDSLLHHPILNSAEFFGGLRTQVQRGKGALVLVLTANISRSQFHEKTQPFNTGSPYFNFTEEVILGALSETKINQLLHQGETYFTDEDRIFIKDIAGGHPYLLQVAASILWDNYEKGDDKDSLQQQQIGQEFNSRVVDTLNDIWQSWPKNTQNAFISVALAHLKKTTSLIQPIDFKELHNIEIEKRLFETNTKPSELNELQQYGFVAKDNTISGGWRVSPSVFFSFVVTHKLPEYRDKSSPLEKSQVSSETNDMWDNLFTPLSLSLVFIGTAIGYFLSNEKFGILSLTVFSGLEPLAIHMVKFFSVLFCAFLVLKLASKIHQRRA